MGSPFIVSGERTIIMKILVCLSFLLAAVLASEPVGDGKTEVESGPHYGGYLGYRGYGGYPGYGYSGFRIGLHGGYGGYGLVYGRRKRNAESNPTPDSNAEAYYGYGGYGLGYGGYGLGYGGYGGYRGYGGYYGGYRGYGGYGYYG